MTISRVGTEFDTKTPPSDAGVDSVAARILADGARHLLGLERLDLAQPLCDLVLSEDEGNADLHSVAANILDRRCDWQGSLACLRRAYALAPQAPQVRLNLAMALLRSGDYREGFSLYEARVEKPGWSGFATPESRAALGHLMLRPGQAVAGKGILLLAEQGLGDGIMFARYIARLIERGARVAVACNPTLRPFFERVAGVETVLAPPADQPLAQINLAALSLDAWAPLLSLASWFETDRASVPAETPYWTPDAERAADWRRRLAGMGRAGAAKVGLVFQANGRGRIRREKSMTSMKSCRSRGSRIDIVNLQHGAAGRDRQGRAGPDRSTPGACAARRICRRDRGHRSPDQRRHHGGALRRCDGPANLAGGPRSPHWAWGLDGETTPWYRSIRIFRQAKRRDWSSGIAALTAQLRSTFPPADAPGPQAQIPQLPSLEALVTAELPATARQGGPTKRAL